VTAKTTTVTVKSMSFGRTKGFLAVLDKALVNERVFSFVVRMVRVFSVLHKPRPHKSSLVMGLITIATARSMKTGLIKAKAVRREQGLVIEMERTSAALIAQAFNVLFLQPSLRLRSAMGLTMTVTAKSMTAWRVVVRQLVVKGSRRVRMGIGVVVQRVSRNLNNATDRMMIAMDKSIMA
jgi:hypothetical protein